MKAFLRIAILSVIFLSSPLLSGAQLMSDYCQLPSSIGTPIDPNLLLVVDMSGSMTWKAYSYGDSDSDGNGKLDGYQSTTTYEGYFDPSKYYVLNGSGVYVETTPTGAPCNKECTNWRCRNVNLGDCERGAHGCSASRWACCTAWSSSGDCDLTSGNYLNYSLMRRVDVLRWALTGGRLESCNNSIQSCDPEVYPNAQLSCDTDGCILLGSDGSTKVKVPWDRITGSHGGLLFQLKNLSPKPLIGAMFYNVNGVINTVYIGDFTGSANYDGVNPYKNVITAVNAESPTGATPTGPALWDAYNYLAQQTAQYGGPQPQTGSGNEWKNPLNRCIDANNDGNCQGSEFVLVPCAKNFLLLLTDGQWNVGGNPVQVPSCKIDNDVEAESPDPVVPAYWMHKTGFTNQPTGLQTYVESIYTLGLWLGGTGENAVKNISMYGSFDRLKSWPGSTSGFPQGTCSPVEDCCSSANCGKGSSCTALPASSSDWDKDGDGVPDTFFKADNAVQIKEQIINIILDILRHVSSGSAVSILASGEGSGANLLQAVYFPRKSFGSTEIDWIGKMHNLWYYVDPYLANSTIREDTYIDKKLNLTNDNIVQFYYDTVTKDTLVRKYGDTNGDGVSDGLIGTSNFDDIENLWEAGKVLWSRNISSSARTIYTQTSGSFTAFSEANALALQSYLRASSSTEAADIIRYVHGVDKTGYRNRTVSIGGTSGVWKLGDIVNSTPRIQSFAPTNTYHMAPPSGYSDTTYSQFINDANYKNRGMAYVGANDGMLHAFFLGNLKQNWTGKTVDEKALLDGGDLAKEMWAFIPKNTLPYIRYLPEQDYCHLYSVDASTFLVDASIVGDPDDAKSVSSWRTILIGGMGLGGACRNFGSTCTDCIKTPTADLGYSSYFAIDVTDPNNPTLLWEFADSELGMSTSGPAIIRQGDSTKNGKWFVVFASGPTGPINTTYRQFLGKADQQLKLFVLDLKTGTLERKISTGIGNAFGSSLYNATLDTDRGAQLSPGHYKDDVVYIGYTQCADAICTSSSTWTKGGVLRLNTKEDPDPAQWSISIVIDDIGPVTAAISKLQDRKNGRLWLYFGTGRYFYKMGTSIDDPGNATDSTTIRRLYGMQEPCYSSATNDIDNTCYASVSPGSLLNQSSSPSLDIGVATGWYINLDTPSSGYLQERLITDPLAVFSGVVFFTTYSPSADICAVGGNTYVWAVNYKSGAQASGLTGKALVQVSTGEIRELDLSNSLTGRDNRRSGAVIGVPPKGQGLSILVGPRPLQKILHIQEK